MRNSKLHLWGSVFFLIGSSLTPLAAQISDTAKQQMADVIRMKHSLTRSQRKLSSHLLFASMKARNQSMGSIPGTMTDQVAQDAAGNVVVDVKADSIGAAEQMIGSVGGTILSNSRTGSIIRARLPINSLEVVAGSNSVRSINTPQRAIVNSVRTELAPFSSPTAPLDSLQQQHRLLKQEMQTALPLLASNGFYPSFRSLLPLHMRPFVGSVTSQGYVTHAANQAVALGVDGTGVRVGVLSDSATPGRVAALIASGDLPADTVVVPGQAGPSDGEDEGTAMMEIVHDMAPGAKLYFATAFESDQGFADNIRTLRFTYHCDVIVDDVSYFGEPAFQDGLISQAVNDITADGGLYFSSAANSGNLTSGTSGTWEGDFRDGGDAGSIIDTFEGIPVKIHNFGTDASPVLYDILTGSSAYLLLHWSDPIGASTNDYDFFLLNASGTALLAASTDTQNGTQDPLEYMFGTSAWPAGSRLVVIQYAGDARALHIDTERGRLAIGTAGATLGHNAGLNTVSMAATAWNSARRGTAVFSAANPVETFSSDGPRKIFFTPDGTSITPGNYLFGTGGGATLQKPDLTAADGVYTKTPGFLPFFGTSAAAPHAAAIAALVKSANPSLTNTQIKQIMVNTAIDIMSPGADRNSGFGITMALPAVQAALVP